MKKKIVMAISSICVLSVVVLGIVLLTPKSLKETKFFINPKSSSAVFDNYINGEFKFSYGDMKIYDISLEDFKIMVKFEDGSVKAISSEDKELYFEFTLATSSNPASIGEYEIIIGYKSLTKTYKVIVSNILVEKPSLISGEFIFDGTIKYPEISNYNFNGNNAGIICFGENFGTNAKNYLLTFSLEEGYSWSDGTTNAVEISWKINKKKVTQEEISALNFEILGEDGLEASYDGSTKTIVSSKVLPEYLEMVGEISAINVGNYVAEIRIKEDFSNNYEFEKNVNTNISWRISKIKINIPILKDAEIDFFEGMNIDKTSLFKAEANNFVDWRDSLIVLATGFNNNITSEGTYNFNFRIIDKAHYMWADGTNEDLTKTFEVVKIEKFVLDLDNSNHLNWNACVLKDNKFVRTYNGNAISIISPAINYAEIVGSNNFIGDEISITQKYYKDDIEITPVNAGIYEVRFYFVAGVSSNFEVVGEYISKELVINKFEVEDFEVSNKVLYLGERLKDNNFEISFKDINNNSIENGNFKFVNPLDMNKIAIENDTVVLELVSDNYIGTISINYNVVDIIDRVVVKDKYDENICNTITGKEFYKLNAYNLDKYYEFYFKTNYDLKLYDDDGNEQVYNILDFSNNIFEYTFRSCDESIILSIANLAFADETTIEKVVATKLLFDGTLISENLVIGLDADYKFESSSGIITGIEVCLKEDFADLNFTSKFVDENGEIVNFSNQINNEKIYIEIYDEEKLIEKRSIFVSYIFEFEKIENHTLEVDSEDFYSKVISSAGNEFYIKNNIIYKYSNGTLIIIEECLELEENKLLYVVSSKNYTSILDDKTGEYSIVDDMMLSKNAICLYGNYYYEVYNENYIKTGEIATLNGGILTIYEILDLEQKENDKYYFLSDKVLLGETSKNIYIQNALGYMLKFIVEQESIKIKIEIVDNNLNKYYINDIITVKKV